MRITATALALGLFSSALLASPVEPVDHEMINRIRHEAFHNSQVMATMTHLTEKIGPRLTNSPQMIAANEWTKKQLADWGLSNARTEAFGPFGRGWTFSESSIEMLAPRALPLHAIPRAWTPGTNGTVEGEAVALQLKTKADLEKHKGTLKGKILFISDAREYKPATEADWQRYDEKDLHELLDFPVPKDRKPADRKAALERFQKEDGFAKELNKFLVEEGALATVAISGWDNGIIRTAGGGSRKADESPGVTGLTMTSVHYNQVMRALDRKETVRLRLNVDSRFTTDKDEMAHNTLADLPGVGAKKNEIVMIGAHLDSWHSGTGAADNAAGVAVMMEAMRILKTLNVKPKRTIRIGLWSGEEQGLLGSAAYVKDHLASYPEPTDPEQKKLPQWLRDDQGELEKKPDHATFAAYFNYDNGGGKIRGIYTQENAAVSPIFKAWLEPLADVGASTVTNRNTGGTDHQSFDRVGLPGFQFVQDKLDYSTHVHHSHLDTLDHIVPEDLKQAAAVVATFAYHAAMRDEKLPRNPLRKTN